MIRVGGETDWPPFDFVENDKYLGVARDYLDLLQKMTGLKFDVVTGYSWDELLQMARSRRIDMLPILFKTAERQEYLAFTNDYLSIRNYVFTRSDDAPYSRLEDLRGRTVAVVKGYGQIEMLARQEPLIRVLVVDSPLGVLDAVLTGRAEAFIENTAVVSYYMKTHGLQGIKPAFPSELSEIDHLYMAVRKDWDILRSILDKTLAAIDREEHDVIAKRWIVPQVLQVQEASDAWQTVEFETEETTFLNYKEQISACVDPDWMPLEGFVNGRYSGIGSEYLGLLSQMLPIDVRVVPTESWEQSIEYVRNRQCDILVMSAETPQRLEYLHFTEPYLDIEAVMATAEDAVFYSDLSDLENESIGMVSGYALVETITANHPDLNLRTVSSSREGLELVRKGELYGFIDALPVLSYLIQKEYIGDLKIGGIFDIDWSMSIGVRNDEPMLLHVFNKILGTIPQVKKQEIVNNWISVRYEKGFDYSLVWQIVAVFLVIAAFFIYRDRAHIRHQREIARKNQELEALNETLHAQKDKISDLALRDALTGIYNRRGFLERLDKAINYSSHHDTIAAVYFIDLDNYKRINDELGHVTGDHVLKVVARRLDENLRESDTLIRAGGDEFVAIVEGVKNRKELPLIAEKLLAVVSEPIPFEDETIHCSCSIGIASYPENGDKSSQLLSLADGAMYQAKNLGKNRYQFSTVRPDNGMRPLPQ